MIRLSRRQVREVDRRAIEQYHMPGVLLMENAAFGVAEVAWEELRRSESRTVLILCGGGNNGGDGFAAARRLHNWGADVTVALYTDPAKLKGDALINWRIVAAMKLRTVTLTPEVIHATDAALLVDAIFGTGLTEPPREPFGRIVEAMDRRALPVVAVDIPSGLDCDTGLPLGPTVRAKRTVTFVAEKTGFANPDSWQYTGVITVAGIGCPGEIIQAVLREVPPV